MAISLVFDGHVRNVDNLGLNVFITFTVAAATELPADTFLTLVLDRWGRRWLACGSMVISGIFSIWACAVSNSELYFYNFRLHILSTINSFLFFSFRYLFRYSRYMWKILGKHLLQYRFAICGWSFANCSACSRSRSNPHNGIRR